MKRFLSVIDLMYRTQPTVISVDCWLLVLSAVVISIAIKSTSIGPGLTHWLVWIGAIFTCLLVAALALIYADSRRYL